MAVFRLHRIFSNGELSIRYYQEIEADSESTANLKISDAVIDQFPDCSKWKLIKVISDRKIGYGR